MPSFRNARSGEAAVYERLISPPGRLLHVGAVAGLARAACLAMSVEAAAELAEALEPQRRRAWSWAFAHWRRLSPGLRRRLGSLREAPLLSREGCPSCREIAAPDDSRRLCLIAGIGGAPCGLAAGASARLSFAARADFDGASGVGGLRLTLLRVLSVELAEALCASS